jgi:tRNA A37 threonylcarbamoyladenosine dehydratase
VTGVSDTLQEATHGAAADLARDPAPDLAPDLERRFGGLRRLYGDAGYTRLRAARFAIVGLGGVGSWAAEALARSGVAELVLIDLDHVAESNINRQVQALTPTLGQAKAQALAERIALIHPGCRVHAVEEFAAPDNWPALLPVPVDGLIDACDQVRAKEALARWSLQAGVPIVIAGAAGGKQRPDAVHVADLAEATHDPLLAALRQRLRRAGVVASGTGTGSARTGRTARTSGLTCVFSREAVCAPRPDGGDEGDACVPPAAADGSLNCHGYGSSVMVTATFGMAAAAAAVARLLRAP